jgi:hypothetical protein
VRRQPGRLRRIAWAAVPVWSGGLLAFLPFLRVALARRRPRDWWVFTGYLAASSVLLGGVGETANSTSDVVGGYALALIGVASVHAFVAFHRLQDAPPGLRGALPAASWQPNAEAVLAAGGRIQRRKEARELARADPELARELRIGRPDLPRDYDDGGLIDVNHVPVSTLASAFELTQDEAEALATARSHLGRFSSPEELSIYSRLPPDRIDAVRDLMFFG